MVAFALLVEEHDVVVGVVGEVALVVGQHQHAFDVRAGADGDAAEKLDEVPERIGAVFVAAEDLWMRWRLAISKRTGVKLVLLASSAYEVLTQGLGQSA